MSREKAFKLLLKNLKNRNLIKHCLACEAAMRGLYKYLHTKDFDLAQIEVWGITGLLHDVDYEIAQDENKLDQHGLLIFDLEKNAIPEPIAHAIKAHNYTNTKVDPESDLDWSIAAVDGLTGLIVACALIHPTRKLEPLTVDFVMKRWGEKSFARGASRETIMLCEEKINIPLAKFIDITLTSMKEVHDELGL